MTARNSIFGILSNIKLFLFSIIVFFGTVFIVLFIIPPFWLYKCTVQILQKCLRHDFYQILAPRSRIWSNFHLDNHAVANILLCMKFQGKVQFPQFLQKISSVVLERESSPNGNYAYPEFQMYLEEWLGYSFWKLDETFNIENHVKMLNIPDDYFQNEEEWLKDFEKDSVKELFNQLRSPWTITFIISPNLETPTFYMHLKFHHTLCDGFSILNVLSKIFDDSSPGILKYFEEQRLTKQAEKDNAPGILARIRSFLAFFVKFPWDVAKCLIKFQTKCVWDLEMKNASLDRILVKSDIIYFSDLKAISTANNVSVFPVILDLLSAGVHRALKKTGKPIPEMLVCPVPTVASNHPLGLTNHYGMMQPFLPLAVEDSQTRLRLCQRSLTDCRNSKISPYLFHMNYLIANIPICLYKPPPNIPVLNFGLTPFWKKEVTFIGQRLVDIHFKAWWQGQTALLFSMISYDERFRLVLNADVNVFQDEDAVREILIGIEEEVSRLKSLTNGNRTISLNISN